MYQQNPYYQSRCLDAIETVLAWELPDEVVSDVINDQARLMAGGDPEDNFPD